MHHTDRLWNGIWSDLFIDSTYMRYGHGPSGIIGCNTERDNPCHMGSVANTMGQMSNDVAELNNHQEHVVLPHMEEQPIHINNNSRDRQSINFVKQLRHELTCLVWVNIKLNDEALLPVQAMAFNVAANKEQLIRLLVKHLCKLIAPNGKSLVVTGPDPRARLMLGVEVLPRAITNEEADIIMAYNMIEESVGGRSPI